MIFSPHHITLIKQGHKTQTRRIATTEECRYREGKAYAAQPGRGMAEEERITVLEVRREKLGDISVKDSKREGYRSIYEFQQAWKEIHGVWDPDLEVWVIRFAAGDLTEQPRFLAAKLGTSRGDYVSDPHAGASGEGEPLSWSEQERMSEEARERDAERDIEPVYGRAARLESEIVDLRKQMRKKGVHGRNIAREIDRAEKALQRMNKLLRAA